MKKKTEEKKTISNSTSKLISKVSVDEGVSMNREATPATYNNITNGKQKRAGVPQKRVIIIIISGQSKKTLFYKYYIIPVLVFW